MSVLHLTPATRAAVLDARSIRERISKEGHEWAPALASANARIVALARGEEPIKQTSEAK